MKLFAASIVALAMIASPAAAQTTNTSATQTTNVKTTTKQVHATNVPVRKHHATARHHHRMHCGCPPTHMKVHHVKKTTTTTKY